MIGFSLAHGIGGILFFAPLALSIWLVVALLIMAGCSLAKDFAFKLVLVGARERNFGSWAPLSTANVLAMGLYRKLCAKHARC
jgi:hypothetical protein